MIKVPQYSYLVVPFNIIESNSTNKFKAYVDNLTMLSAVSKDSTNEQLVKQKTWIPGRVFRKKKILFREQMAYSHFKQIFNAFACNDSDGNKMPDSSICVLNLNRYSDEELFDKPLNLILDKSDNVSDKIEFAIHNMENSFDAVKLILNINASVGLIVIPVATSLGIGEFQRFIYLIRNISKRSIKQKGSDEKTWSIQNRIEEWMSDFDGCYVLTCQEAQHLSFLINEKALPIEEQQQLILKIARSQQIVTSNKTSGVDFLEVPNQLLICSAMEGTAIMTIAERGIDNITHFKNMYSTEQTERYIVFMSVLLQRYALICIIHQLTKLGNQMNNATTNRPSSPIDMLTLQREQVKAASLIRIENYFSHISEYSLYNEFYQMCSNSHGIKQLYTEIEQKMSMLNTYLTQQSDDRHEKAEWQLSIILAILTVTSATNDISQLSSGVLKQPWLFIIGLLFAITIFFYIFKMIFKNLRK